MRYLRRIRRRRQTAKELEISRKVDLQQMRIRALAMGIGAAFKECDTSEELDNLLLLVENDLRPAMVECERLFTLLYAPRRRKTAAEKETIQ